MESPSPIDVLESTIQQLEEEVPADVRYQVYQKRVQVDKHKAELLGTAAALRPQDPTSPTFQLDLQLYQAAVGSVKDQVANFEASLWAANPELYEAHLKLQQLQAFRDQVDLLQRPDGAASATAKLRAPSITGSAASMASLASIRANTFSAQFAAQRSAMSTIIQRSGSGIHGPSSPYSPTLPLPPNAPHTPPGRVPTPLSPTALDPNSQNHPNSQPYTYTYTYLNTPTLPSSNLPTPPSHPSPTGGSFNSTGDPSPGLPPNMLSLQQHVVSLLTNPAAKAVPRPVSRLPTAPPPTSSLSALGGHMPSAGQGPHASAPSILPMQATDPLAALSAAAAGAAAAIATNMNGTSNNTNQDPMRSSTTSLSGLPPISQQSFNSATSHGSQHTTTPSAPSVPRVPNPGVQKPPLSHVLLKELGSGAFSFSTPHGTVMLDADDVELAKQLAGCEISDESYDSRPLQLLLPKDAKKEEGEKMNKLVAQEEADGMRIALPDGRTLKVSKDTYTLYQQLNTNTLAELARLVSSPSPPSPEPTSTHFPTTSSPMTTSAPQAMSPAAHVSDLATNSVSSIDSSRNPSVVPSSQPSVGSTGPAPQSTEEWVAASRKIAVGRAAAKEPEDTTRRKSEESTVTPSLRTSSQAGSESNSSVRSGASEEDDGRDWRLFQKVVTAEGVTVCEVTGSWPNQKFRWRQLKEMPEKPAKKSSTWFKRTRSADSRSSDGKSR